MNTSRTYIAGIPSQLPQRTQPTSTMQELEALLDMNSSLNRSAVARRDRERARWQLEAERKQEAKQLLKAPPHQQDALWREAVGHFAQQEQELQRQRVVPRYLTSRRPPDYSRTRQTQPTRISETLRYQKPRHSQEARRSQEAQRFKDQRRPLEVPRIQKRPTTRHTQTTSQMAKRTQDVRRKENIRSQLELRRQQDDRRQKELRRQEDLRRQHELDQIQELRRQQERQTAKEQLKLKEIKRKEDFLKKKEAKRQQELRRQRSQTAIGPSVSATREQVLEVKPQLPSVIVPDERTTEIAGLKKFYKEKAEREARDWNEKFRMYMDEELKKKQEYERQKNIQRERERQQLFG